MRCRLVPASQEGALAFPPPQRTPFLPSLAVSLIILKIKNKPKHSSA